MTDDTETKAERFKRMATARVQRAVKAISLVGNLAGPGYERTDEQAAKIVAVLRGAVDEIDRRFAARGRKPAGPDFAL